MYCFCASSRRLARALTARYDAALVGSGMTAAQFELLSVLATLGPGSGRVLASRMALDKTTLSRNVRPMVEAGWIEAQAPETDGRALIYTVSAAGERRLQKAMPLWQRAHDASVEMLGAYAPAAERGLQRMTQALQVRG